MYRQNAKISVQNSGKLDKYEYLSGEDLGYRPSKLDQIKSEYSPLGEVFNKRLDSNEKQEGLLKRLKNIEDKTDNQLQAIEGQKDNQTNLKSVGYAIRDKLPEKAIKAFDWLKKTRLLTIGRFFYRGGNEVDYDFTSFSSLGDLLKQIYYGKILIPAVEREQDEFDYFLDNLKKYNPRDQNNINEKAVFLNNIENFYDGRKMVIKAFKNKIIPLADGSYYQCLEEEKDISWM